MPRRHRIEGGRRGAGSGHRISPHRWRHQTHRVLLIEIDTDDVEEVGEVPSYSLEELNPAEHDLLARLPAALMILSWINEWSLEEENDASIVVLPSASHVSDEPPHDWASPSGR